MLVQKINREYNYPLTRELARQQLKNELILAQYYTNDNSLNSIVHSHPFFEMILPIAGVDVNYYINGEVYHISIGDIIFIPKEIYHSATPAKETASDRLVVQIDSSIWSRALEHTGLVSPIWNQQVTVVHKDIAATWDFRGLFERMINTQHLKPEYQNIVLESLLVELQILLEQTVTDHTVAAPNSTSQLVAKVVYYMQNHYTDPNLTVAELAQEAFVSREHLSRAFKEFTMESIHGYLTNLRMQHCRRAIADGKSVLDACMESGFSNYSSFYKSFRTLYGITPTEYRRQLLSSLEAI